MKNGWTGGQYSLFRVLFGTYLFIHFVHLTPWAAELFSNQGLIPDAAESPLALPVNIFRWLDSPEFVAGIMILAAGMSVIFALGWQDRWAAVLLWYIWACLFGRNPLISNPGLPYVGWLLLAHAFLPVAPYGSLAARGRTDPGGGWQMPRGIFLVAWILLVVGYSYSGATKLVSPSWVDGTAMKRVMENPLARPYFLREWLLALPMPLLKIFTWGSLGLELLSAPLALFRRVRPFLWAALVGMHLSLICVIDFADLTIGMLMIHFFTFDPNWIKPRPAAADGVERVYYDGHCGLCHRWVRFVLAEDPEARTFRLSPIQGETLAAEVSAETRESLPDSIIVQTATGELLIKSSAIIYIGGRLGGIWRVLSWCARAVPRPIRDAAYTFIASIRYRLFAKPSEACPLLPPELRQRFDP